MVWGLLDRRRADRAHWWRIVERWWMRGDWRRLQTVRTVKDLAGPNRERGAVEGVRGMPKLLLLLLLLLTLLLLLLLPGGAGGLWGEGQEVFFRSHLVA